MLCPGQGHGEPIAGPLGGRREYSLDGTAGHRKANDPVRIVTIEMHSKLGADTKVRVATLRNESTLSDQSDLSIRLLRLLRRVYCSLKSHSLLSG